MPSKDPAVNKRARDKWYKANSAKQMAAQRLRRRQLLLWLGKLKRGLSCAHCGMSFADRPECADFHHTDSAAKEGNVSRLVTFSIQAVKAELEKCICLCSNCHRTVHKTTMLGLGKLDEDAP